MYLIPTVRPVPHATACEPRPATCKPPPHARCWPRGSVEIIGETRDGPGGSVTHYTVATLIDPDRPVLVPAHIVHEHPPTATILDAFLARRAAGERG